LHARSHPGKSPKLNAQIEEIVTYPQGRLRVLLIAATLLFAVTGVHAASSKAVMAYYESSGSTAALHSFYSYMNQLPTDTFGTDIQGNVSGTAPAAALSFAQSKGMLTFATISNFGATDFDPQIAHAIVNSPARKSRFIASALLVVQTSHYSGVNIDFESIPHKDRAAFSSFVRDVATAMRAQGLLTVVSVPAALNGNPNDSWTGAFNFKTIGHDADIFQLMTYDENGPWGPPGPVAGLDWVNACLKYAVSVVPSTKISLGIPAYGYDWNTTKSTGVQVPWKTIPALIAKTGATPQWDAATSSPFFNYQAKDGSNHVVWYEDATSIPLKSGLVLSNNLAGVSVFALGFEDQSFWLAVHSVGF
jgi:spore germination protein YaaH